MTGIFRIRTFANGRTRTYVAVLVNKWLRKCDRRRVRPVANYLFQVAPTYLLTMRSTQNVNEESDQERETSATRTPGLVPGFIAWRRRWDPAALVWALYCC